MDPEYFKPISKTLDALSSAWVCRPRLQLHTYGDIIAIQTTIVGGIHKAASYCYYTVIPNCVFMYMMPQCIIMIALVYNYDSLKSYT